MNLKEFIRDVPDFPKPGIIFKDVTTLVAAPRAFHHVLSTWQSRFQGAGVTAIAGIESRGFIFGAPLADRLGVRFVPIRKPGKLPYKTVREDYALEYGIDAVEMHEDAIQTGEAVVIIDDLLATGGTANAAASLVQKLGGRVIEVAFVIELAFLGARVGKLKDYQISSLVSYDGE